MNSLDFRSHRVALNVAALIALAALVGCSKGSQESRPSADKESAQSAAANTPDRPAANPDRNAYFGAVHVHLVPDGRPSSQRPVVGLQAVRAAGVPPRHHDVDVGQQPDVAQHVAADGDEVGEQPRLDRADPVAPTSQPASSAVATTPAPTAESAPRTSSADFIIPPPGLFLPG